ncbi:MAG: hypothetical protein K1Y01_07785 [Vicinamibacteria bacterium]|nr:hypothetical protein [Vicinamibacteria bacterium]
MTLNRRRPTPENASLRFLVEDLLDVVDAPESAIRAMQQEAATVLLPGATQALSRQQRRLIALPPAEFQELRRFLLDQLRSVALPQMLPPGIERIHDVKLRLNLQLRANAGPGGVPIVDGSVRDVLWFYVAHLVSRAGTSKLTLCPAPRSQREAAADAAFCGRLFVRRGTAKEFCSPTCRARVATQRARHKGATASVRPKRPIANAHRKGGHK